MWETLTRKRFPYFRFPEKANFSHKTRLFPPLFLPSWSRQQQWQITCFRCKICKLLIISFRVKIFRLIEELSLMLKADKASSDGTKVKYFHKFWVYIEYHALLVTPWVRQAFLIKTVESLISESALDNWLNLVSMFNSPGGVYAVLIYSRIIANRRLKSFSKK